MRVAFTVIGAESWTGGYNYLLNLLQALVTHAPDRIQPVVFAGAATSERVLAPLAAVGGVELVRASAFNDEGRNARLGSALLRGLDNASTQCFSTHNIDVVFESARFFGWRLPIPAIAWIPDLQHRQLRHFFSNNSWWKRELGFRVQIASSRTVMVSSEDARHDCERFYPATRGHIEVVQFALPAKPRLDQTLLEEVRKEYGLPETFFFLPNQFWAHKNHECVIRAVHLLKQQGMPLVIAVTGKQADSRDHAHMPRLQKLIDTLDVRAEFRLLGLVPHSHMAALLQGCAALINPSHFEGWSTTVEEAKAAGTPMLLSDLPVHREQAEAQAVFFNPKSPENLAQKLADHRLHTVGQRRELMDRAESLSANRVKKYADDFVRVVERAAGQQSRLQLPGTSL